jgi:hypothetical protein
MKAARPSRTAHFVALGRAMADAGVSHVQEFRDPTARIFLTEQGKRSLATTVQAVRAGKRGIRMEAARAMGDMIALRTMAIDAAVRDAIVDGATQLVILGAGYDGRAWRMPELAGVKVFEVDHPATQGENRARLSELPKAAGVVTFVRRLRARVARRGARARRSRSRVADLLALGGRRHVPHARRGARHARRRRGPERARLRADPELPHRASPFLARLMFRLIGEAQISAWTPAEMAADLGSVGFAVREDSGMAEWNGRFARGEAKVERGAYMRIAVARTQRRMTTA